MDFLIAASWSGAPLMVGLLFAVTRRKFRALAIATLLIAVPPSVLLAFNNNQANAVRNFFMGIIMFGLPLLLHAGLISLIKNWQSNSSFKRDALKRAP